MGWFQSSCVTREFISRHPSRGFEWTYLHQAYKLQHSRQRNWMIMGILHKKLKLSVIWGLRNADRPWPAWFPCDRHDCNSPQIGSWHFVAWHFFYIVFYFFEGLGYIIQQWANFWRKLNSFAWALKLRSGPHWIWIPKCVIIINQHNQSTNKCIMIITRKCAFLLTLGQLDKFESNCEKSQVPEINVTANLTLWNLFIERTTDFLPYVYRQMLVHEFSVVTADLQSAKDSFEGAREITNNRPQ